MVVLEQNTMFILNVVALAVGPIIVAALIVLLRKRDKLVWSTEGWFRFPLASIVAAASTFGLAYLYSTFSTYVSTLPKEPESFLIFICRSSIPQLTPSSPQCSSRSTSSCTRSSERSIGTGLPRAVNLRSVLSCSSRLISSGGAYLSSTPSFSRSSKWAGCTLSRSTTPGRWLH